MSNANKSTNSNTRGMPKKLVDIAGPPEELRMEVDAVYTLRALVHVPWPAYVVDDVPVDAMECGVTERCIYMDFKSEKMTGYYSFGEGNRLATFSDASDPNGLVVLNKVAMADSSGMFGACRRKVICHGDTMFRVGLSDAGEMQLYLTEGSEAVHEVLANPRGGVTVGGATVGGTTVGGTTVGGTTVGGTTVGGTTVGGTNGGGSGKLCFTTTTIEHGTSKNDHPIKSGIERARDAYDIFRKREDDMKRKPMQRPSPYPEHVNHMSSNRFGQAEHGVGIHGVPTVEELGWKRNSR